MVDLQLSAFKHQRLVYMPSGFKHSKFCVPPTHSAVFYVLQNKHRLLTYTAIQTGFYNREELCLLRGTGYILILR